MNYERHREAEKALWGARQDIKSIGLVNKDMQERMEERFLPAKRPFTELDKASRIIREKSRQGKQGKNLLPPD